VRTSPVLARPFNMSSASILFIESTTWLARPPMFHIVPHSNSSLLFPFCLFPISFSSSCFPSTKKPKDNWESELKKSRHSVAVRLLNLCPVLFPFYFTHFNNTESRRY
jgi:hypothetical protein